MVLHFAMSTPTKKKQSTSARLTPRKRLAMSDLNTLDEAWSFALASGKSPRKNTGTSTPKTITMHRLSDTVLSLNCASMHSHCRKLETTLDDLYAAMGMSKSHAGFTKSHLLYLAWEPLIVFAQRWQN